MFIIILWLRTEVTFSSANPNHCTIYPSTFICYIMYMYKSYLKVLLITKTNDFQTGHTESFNKTLKNRICPKDPTFNITSSSITPHFLRSVALQDVPLPCLSVSCETLVSHASDLAVGIPVEVFQSLRYSVLHMCRGTITQCVQYLKV